MSHTTLQSTLDTALQAIAANIDWDNWEHTDEDGGHVAYWGVLEVLWCKLDWLREEKKLPDEFVDVVADIQRLVACRSNAAI